MWGLSIFDQLACRIEFKRLRYDGRFTPPSLRGSLIYPGNQGVFNWGSVAVDPARQVMFGAVNHLAYTSRLVPRSEIPMLAEDATEAAIGLKRNIGAPYGVAMAPFLGPLGIPCQAPPWGFITGADLRTGKISYLSRNGTFDLESPLPVDLGIRDFGVQGLGGPIVTRGGLAFLAATKDGYLRAFDLTSGRRLWQAKLPAGGQATPMTYALQDGRQFVVIAAGGHGELATQQGDHVIAYSLP